MWIKHHTIWAFRLQRHEANRAGENKPANGYAAPHDFYALPGFENPAGLVVVGRISAAPSAISPAADGGAKRRALSALRVT